MGLPLDLDDERGDVPTTDLPQAKPAAPKSAEFRREREHHWRELERLLEKVDRVGVRGLTGPEVYRLPALYRETVSALSVARATSLDKNLLEYLTALSGRAYLCVYANRRHPLDAALEFLTSGFPRLVRAQWRFVAASALLLALGVACGYFVTLSDPERFYGMVGEEIAQGRTPAATTEDLRAALYADGGGLLAGLHLFATFLFTHNSQVGILCFVLGFAAGIPVAFLLFQNGLPLGALAAVYESRGLGLEFWAWVLPHGVTELTAIVLCGAGGLVLGASLVFPGRHSRLQNLALRGRDAAALALGAIVMLLFAALIEGFFRQIVQDVTIRFGVAATTLVAWLLYFGLAGRKAPRAG